MATYTTQIQALYVAYFGRPADVDGLNYWEKVVTAAKGSTAAVSAEFAKSAEYLNAYKGMTQSQIVNTVYVNLFGHPADTAGLAYWVDALQKGHFTLANAVTTIAAGAQGSDKVAYDSKVAAATAFTNELNTTAEIIAYSGDTANGKAKSFITGVTSAETLAVAITPVNLDAVIQNIVVNGQPGGHNFSLTSVSAQGADVMILRGNEDVRIDFTNPLQVVRGLDLNGDGIIAADGVENNLPLGANSALAANPADSKFEIVDAYARNRFNEGDRINNFFGDIQFDGTAYEGDGVNTDGNIFLGGLGADTAFGGVGNDFLVGGGVATSRIEAARAEWIAKGGTNANFVAPVDSLSGGRNADFFFVEMSALDSVDGNGVRIDGGTTADDNAGGATQSAQDADWLLFEGSDDDEPVTIRLRDDTTLDDGEVVIDQTGSVVSRSGQAVGSLRDIENFDASGNLYGFLNDIAVELGGRAYDDRVAQNGALNNAIGSSAQLNVIGSNVGNIIIGGYDNDNIEGRDGADLLMGGNLNYLINPNLLNITLDGKDFLTGGLGNDDIVFEADGGQIEGGNVLNTIEGDTDTLWLTSRTLGTKTVSDLTTDNVLRFDLNSQNIDTAAGYGGADNGSPDNTANDTQDQTNYKAGVARTKVLDMDSVIATGLGAVDYDTDGTNEGDVGHISRMNSAGYEGNLTLRGTAGANILYANTGNDVIEGRQGNDSLSGGRGNDDFIFELLVESGDGVDVVHRQSDVNGDGFWDGYSDATRLGTFEKDFGAVGSAISTNSKLTLTLVDTANPTTLAGFPVNGVAFTLGGTAYTVTSAAMANTTYAGFVTALNAALDANAALAPLTAVLNADNTITITDPAGKPFVATGYTWVGNIIPAAGTLTWNMVVGAPQVDVPKDRLIYQSYEDRADGEKTNDNATTGSTISLGRDAYAEDLVINFSADGTRIAEDQAYTATFLNLTTQDTVTVSVNGVTYTLTVGIDLDGNSIAAEDGVGDAQPAIQAAFLTRLTAFINSFMDDDTAAGRVSAALAGSTITLTQAAYNGEETVFMTTPVITIQQSSVGEQASVVVTNVSQHEVHLLNFDGRNALLNNETALFLGDTGTNRSYLQTALTAGGALTGTDAILVDGGVNDLAGVANNTATNAFLATNFTAHGDDFLIGGAGVDVISGGTGDDRVQGSLGNDTADGGKNMYAVKILGETEARVLKLNVWEAANLSQAAVAAANGLTGLVISTVTLIQQTEDGSTLVSGAYDDTLQFAQADFNANTSFTVTLNNFTVTGGVVEQRNGGAGTVGVDNGGDGTIDATTTFTNFENIRTVSGTGRAIAGAGQGNDTLNVVALSNVVGGASGISYDLTNNATAGEVKYSADAHASLTRPVIGDFESLVIRVDGVENVISGTGDDLLVIDETEAAKNNSFRADLGDDRIEYQNLYVGGTLAAEPTVTVKVNTSADVDQVVMTGGRVGTTVATDTLTSVEFITLAGQTAESGREDDVLDVTAMAAGAIVNFADGTVRDLAGVVQVTIEQMQELENVYAEGTDTVLVGDAAVMGTNARSDFANGTAAVDIAFASFLDFDQLNASNKRVAFANQNTAQIEDVINQNQFTFSLSRSGSTADVDTVDYSLTNDAIAVVVELDVTRPNQYVMVDDDAAIGTFSNADGAGNNNRIDTLISVERIVASQGESVLDLTNSTKDLKIDFQSLNLANRVAALDRDVYTVQISDLSTSTPLTRNYVEYRDAGLLAPTVALPDQVKATWSRIEGSDRAEVVILNSAHSLDTNTFNLRGGDNQVKYNELTKSITLTLGVTDFVAATPLTTGLIQGTVTFQDGTGAGVPGPTLPGSTQHNITSYTADNGIAAGSLRIAASQDAEDTLAIAGLDTKVFLISEVGTTDNQITVRLGSGTATNSVILTGFELVSDAGSGDVYDFGSLVNAAAGLNFIDNVNDHDTIKVANDAKGFNGAAATQISLELINTSVALAPGGFDFDVLDVTKVTDLGVTTLTGVVATAAAEGVAAGVAAAAYGTTDEVVFGKINNVTSALLFESVVLTNDTIAEVGTVFTMNTTTNQLIGGAKTIGLTDLTNTVSFGGTVLEQAANGTLRPATALNATTGVTINAVGAEAVNFTGGNGADVLNGANGNDVLRGGSGNDTINGGFTAATGPIYTVTLSGATATSGAAGSTMTIGGLVITTAAVPVGAQVAPAADADQIGAAFVAQPLANFVAALQTAAGGSLTLAQASTLTGVSYNATTNALSFSFSTAADAALINAALVGDPAVTGTAVLGAVETNTQAFAPQVESSDLIVFEATAALNGVDTINNFNAAALATDDVLSFRAFLGGAAPSVHLASDFAAGFAMGANNVGVFFNKATLAAGDINLAGGAGKIGIADNGKAVIITTADVDGVSDATINAYNVYYVEDTNASLTAQTYTVTLVGTINSTTELNAAQITAASFF